MASKAEAGERRPALSVPEINTHANQLKYELGMSLGRWEKFQGGLESAFWTKPNPQNPNTKTVKFQDYNTDYEVNYEVADEFSNLKVRRTTSDGGYTEVEIIDHPEDKQDHKQIPLVSYTRYKNGITSTYANSYEAINQTQVFTESIQVARVSSTRRTSRNS